MNAVEPMTSKSEVVIFRKVPNIGKKTLTRIILLDLIFIGMSVLAPLKLWLVVQQGLHITWSPRIYIPLGLELIFAMSTAIILTVISIKSFRRCKHWIEVSSDGITEKGLNGYEVEVKWDQIENRPSTSNVGVFVLSSMGRKIVVNREYLGYEDLLMKIREEIGRREKLERGKVESYSMESGMGCFAWVSVIIFSGMLILDFFLLSNCIVDKAWPGTIILLSLSSIGMGVFLIYSFQFLKAVKSHIEISTDGISKFNKDGSSVCIHWDHVSCLLRRPYVRQLVVCDEINQQKILVDDQFSGFKEIQERVIKEYSERLRPISLPMLCGKKLVLPNSPMELIGLGMVGLLAYIRSQNPHHETGSFIACIVFFIACYIWTVFQESKFVKGVTFSNDGLGLHRLFGVVSLSWEQVSGLGTEIEPTRSGCIYHYVIHTKKGKAYRLSPIMPERIEIYARIMKEMEVRDLKPEV
jgi:hypothetical protein